MTSTSDPLLDLITACHASGWYLNNLYYHPSGHWCANLRTTTHYTDFGRGPDPLSALHAAIDAIHTSQPLPPQAASAYSIAQPIDITSLFPAPRPLSTGTPRRL